MMKFAVPAILVAATIILYGCISVSPPQSCAPLPSEQKALCTYREAVSAQNPYACYSIADAKDRETCLKDAIDPAAAKKLSRTAKATSATSAKIAQPSAVQQPQPQNATNETEAIPVEVAENSSNTSS